jgi:hypothetical protein
MLDPGGLHSLQAPANRVDSGREETDRPRYVARGPVRREPCWILLRSVMRIRSAHKACAWWFEMFHVEQPRVQQLVCAKGGVI